MKRTALIGTVMRPYTFVHQCTWSGTYIAKMAQDLSFPKPHGMHGVMLNVDKKAH